MAPCLGAAPRWNDDDHDSRGVCRIGDGFDTPVHEESAWFWSSPRKGTTCTSSKFFLSQNPKHMDEGIG